MKLDQQAIDSFKLAIKKERGIILENDEATELANRLFTMMSAIYRERKPRYKEISVTYNITNI